MFDSILDTHRNSSSCSVPTNGFPVPDSSFIRKVSLLSIPVSPVNVFLEDVCKSACRTTLTRFPDIRAFGDSEEGRLAVVARCRDQAIDKIAPFIVVRWLPGECFLSCIFHRSNRVLSHSNNQALNSRKNYLQMFRSVREALVLCSFGIGTDWPASKGDSDSSHVSRRIAESGGRRIRSLFSRTR
jgi:hypothetical protein